MLHHYHSASAPSSSPLDGHQMNHSSKDYFSDAHEVKIIFPRKTQAFCVFYHDLKSWKTTGRINAEAVQITQRI